MISSFLLIPAMTYSPTKRIRSTIGAGGLNFCVRDGYRCDPSAIITRIIFFSLKLPSRGSLKTTQCIMFQPYIILSFTCVLVKPSTYQYQLAQWITPLTHLTYLPDHPSGVLLPYRNGKSHLKVCFALRCFQRLSVPDIATQLCLWRDNWFTSGLSNPVLSYQGQLPSNFLRLRWIGTELSHDVLNPARVPL